MRKTIVYIAMSVDGYIADKQGGVEWLVGDNAGGGSMGSYPLFIESVDTIVLGYKTYRQIKTELSPDEWIYKGKTSYVITHTPEPSTDEIRFSPESLPDLVSRLKAGTGQDIWICGGASIVNQLRAADLIDRYHITVIPTILGEGIPLFEPQSSPTRLRLVSTGEYDGMVDLVYEPLAETE